MTTVVLFNKPFAVLSQFSDPEGRATLRDFIELPGIYPAGRLDFDSEGLMVLTDDGGLQHRISHPMHKQPKTYMVQVEGVPQARALQQLRRGVMLKDGMARAQQASLLARQPPWLWKRQPPIRQRRKIPTAWLELVISEGRNRQVRRMTAAVGLPTLRLIRYAVGDYTLQGLEPGRWRQV